MKGSLERNTFKDGKKSIDIHVYRTTVMLVHSSCTLSLRRMNAFISHGNMLKKFPAFNVTPRLITVSTKALHLSPSSVR
jgi:hypothetical protein